MINHTMEQTATVYTTTRDKFGNYSVSSSNTIKCRFRVITELDNISNREEIRSDALLWVKSDQVVEEGTLIQYDGENYKVTRIVEARRLRGSTVYFKKCLMEKYGEIDNS